MRMIACKIPVTAALLLGALMAMSPMTAARAQDLQFNFSGFGNPERPFPGYVGPFQLGPVTISGSGVVRETDGALLSGGLINLTADLRDPQYPNHRTTWQVVRGFVQRAGARTVLSLQVQVVGANYPFICPVGTLGIVTLFDDKTPLPNGQTSDGIATQFPNPPSIAPDGGAACRTYNHGMNNTDVAWADPPRGGPPAGGNWAIVNVSGGPPGGGVAACQTLQTMNQAESRDSTGKITVEASIIHVVSCAGGGQPLYIYEYVNRPAFRVIRPPDWGHAIGGRDVATFNEALGIAAAAPRF